jgi:murein DD-endopeptidase MepM/ murein hydrolase activator NlpD
MTLKRKRQSAIVLALNLVLVLLLPGIIARLQAQEPEGNRTNHAGFPAVYPPPVAPPEIPPFILPFQGPPGPSTWFLEQAYGNTATAFILRDMFYTAGQGLHFGLDFTAPCGAEVVAIGDGVVVEIDTHGAPPHSLIIDHPNGYTSLYGHLLERPTLQIGQPVKQGDVVALSGDSFETCRSAPHLHLEIRSNFHDRTYNPQPLIKADWANLSLIGSSRQGYQRDLDNPRMWQTSDDQPIVFFGGLMLNTYEYTWPPPQGEWRE